MKSFPPSLTTQELLSHHREKRNLIRKRLREFACVPAVDYFYELAYCLLTPQSSAFNADRVVNILRHDNFLETSFNPEPVLRKKEHYVRFHRTKAKRLLELRSRFPIVATRLAEGGEPETIREWLVGNVKGLGWKEASHFLRNIGHRDLAILDRHILRNLLRVGVIRKLPAALTPKRYKTIEKKFRKFASVIAIPMDELDLLFWSMETGEIWK